MPLTTPLLACYAAIFDLKDQNVDRTQWNMFVNAHFTNGQTTFSINDFYWNFHSVSRWFRDRHFFPRDNLNFKRSECEVRLFCLFKANDEWGPALVRDMIEEIVAICPGATEIEDFSDTMLQVIRDFLIRWRPEEPFSDLASFYNTMPIFHDPPTHDHDDNDKENRRPETPPAGAGRAVLQNANLRSMLYELHNIGQM